MYLIHIADSHLGRAAFQKTAEDGSNLRETLIYQNFLDGIETRIIGEHPDVVAHGGDLFDTVKPKTKALLVAMKALDLLKEAGIPLVIVAGNHSMQKNAYTTSAFEILERAHPEAHFAYSFKYERFEIGDTMFHCIPNMLHAADYAKAAAEVQISKSHNNVLITHGLATTIRDKRLSTVAEFELTPDILSEKFDYIALGHYHGQMQVGPNAWYSGSQENLTYGEIQDKKGALEVCIGNGKTSVGHFSLVRSPMQDLGTINCERVNIDDIVDAIHDEVGLLDGNGNQMFQVTLDFGSSPVVSIPAEELEDIRDNILDLKIRVRSEEVERQQIQQQDLHTIDYVDAWNQFMGPLYPMSESMRAAVKQKGSDTLKTVMANHSEVTE
jgi:DNA repair exonuclease SbcCD nuclease subunit